MGRELRRKQQKKQGKIEKITKEEVKDVNPYNDINKMLKTFGLLLGIILVIYFLVAVLITKEIEWFSKDNDEKELLKVQNSILAKNTFNQTEEEYYVYFYDFYNADKTLATVLSVKLADSKIYQVDTSDAFNSNYVTEEDLGNSGAKTLEDLKVITPTLIKVSNGEIVEYYETTKNILSFLE